MCMPLPETLRSGEQRRQGSSAGCPGLVSQAPHAHAAAPLPFDAAAKGGGEFLKRGERAGKLKEGGRKEKRKRQREFKEREQKRRRERRVKETECYTSWGLEKPKIIENRRRLPWVESILLCRTGVYKGSKSFLEKLPTAEKEEGFLQFQRQKSKGFHLPAPHFLHSKQPHQQVWFLVFLFFAKLGIWCVVFLSQTLLWFFLL